MSTIPSKPNSSRTLIIVLAVALVIALCGVVGLFAAFLSQAGAGTHIEAAQPTATTAATVTPSQHTLAVAYTALIARDANKLSDALGVVSDQCGSDVAACDTAVVAASNTDKSFLHDIQGAQVPTCLQAADATLQDGLSALYTGLIDSHTGLQAQDGALVTQGAHEITAASTTIARATKQIAQVSCP